MLEWVECSLFHDVIERETAAHATVQPRRKKDNRKDNMNSKS